MRPLRLALACLSLLAAAPVPDGYRMEPYRGDVPDHVPGAGVIGTEALAALVRSGSAVLIDVLPAPRRPPEMRADAPWMPLPHQDIPGSIWLPDVGRGALSPQADAWFRSQLDDITRGDKAKTLVFYCLARCWMSWNASKRAASYGYTRVLWYPEGNDGWTEAHHPLEDVASRAP